MSDLILPIWFFFTAALYATVGFGGGSTYTALLAISDVDVWRIPIISLVCNISVVALGSYLAVTRRAFNWRTALPFFVGSIPMAFIGGLIPIREDVYILLLAICLLLAGLRLLFIKDDTLTGVVTTGATGAMPTALGIGGFLGLISGMVGIGGGIFLAPILHNLRWADAKTIAALCSFFILVNSLAGLSGQLIKTGFVALPAMAGFAAPMVLAVIIGGLIGSRILLERFSHNRLRQITAALIIFVALRLLLQL